MAIITAQTGARIDTAVKLRSIRNELLDLRSSILFERQEVEIIDQMTSDLGAMVNDIMNPPAEKPAEEEEH